MDLFLTFVSEHWILWAALAMVFVWIIRLETSGQVNGVSLLNAQEVVQQMNHENAVVIDIRSDDLYKNGHILGSLSMNQQDIEANLKKLNKYKKRPIVLVCQMGQHSPKIGAILLKEGFEHIYGIRGGMRAWEDADLPVSKSS